MTRLYVSEAPSEPLVVHPVGDLTSVLASGRWFWLDGTAEELLPLLTDPLRLAQHDLEDISTESELPKYGVRSDYLFVIAHTPSGMPGRFRTVELDIVVSKRFIVTVHREPVPALEALIGGIDQTRVSSPGELLSRILKAIAGRYLPLVGAPDTQLDELEELAITGDPNGLDQLQALRRDTIRVRRVLAPMREAVRQLGSSDLDVLGGGPQPQIRAAADDFASALEGMDTARLLLAAILDTYRASVAERMNEVMKVLTVFSAIVLPLSLMAGIYGMNFANMPELQVPWAYFALLAVMAAVGLGLWTYFARRGFIGGPKVPRVDRVVGRGLSAFLHLTLAPARTILDSPRRSDTEPPDSV